MNKVEDYKKGALSALFKHGVEFSWNDEIGAKLKKSICKAEGVAKERAEEIIETAFDFRRSMDKDFAWLEKRIEEVSQ